MIRLTQDDRDEIADAAYHERLVDPPAWSDPPPVEPESDAAWWGRRARTAVWRRSNLWLLDSVDVEALRRYPQET